VLLLPQELAMLCRRGRAFDPYHELDFRRLPNHGPSDSLVSV
jgi:hypothetical protein